MPKLDEQIKTLAGYFAADCEPDGKLTLQLAVSYTHLTLPTNREV